MSNNKLTTSCYNNSNLCHKFHLTLKALCSLKTNRFNTLYKHKLYSNTKLCNNTFRLCNKWSNTIFRISHTSFRKSVRNLLHRFPN